MLISLFVLTASAEDTEVSDLMKTDEKMSSTLALKIAEASPTDELRVLILLKNQHKDFNTPNGKSKIKKDQQHILSILEDEKFKGKAKEIKSIYVVNAIAASVTPDTIDFLSKRSDVYRIELDQAVYVADSTEPNIEVISSVPTYNAASTIVWGVNKIGAPAVWQKGITGKGIIVAVVDSGIDASHPDLASLPNTNNPKVIGWIDYVNGRSSPYDDNWHGTHVSGTISGICTKGYQTGVAPGTNLIVAKVFNQAGSGYFSNVLSAFDWAVDNKARIISYSGTGKHYAPMTIAIDNVMAAGVIPVIAAGNAGPVSSSIGCPGDESNSTTVGATDSSDLIASFSSRGSVNLNGKQYIKPSECAPGVSVISTYPASRYARADGTSMATPHYLAL